MNFSNALTSLKQGDSAARQGWNGEGLRVYAQFPDEHSKMGNPYLYIDARALGGERNPWVPSQTDLFADDWVVYPAGSEEDTAAPAEAEDSSDEA